MVPEWPDTDRKVLPPANDRLQVELISSNLWLIGLSPEGFSGCVCSRILRPSAHSKL
jgi:hypothetical protein